MLKPINSVVRFLYADLSIMHGVTLHIYIYMYRQKRFPQSERERKKYIVFNRHTISGPDYQSQQRLVD